MSYKHTLTSDLKIYILKEHACDCLTNVNYHAFSPYDFSLCPRYI